MFIGLMFFSGTVFVKYYFGNVDPTQIAFLLNLKVNGSEENTFIVSFLIYCLGLSIVLSKLLDLLLKIMPYYYKFEFKNLNFRIRTFSNYFPVAFFVISFYIFYSQLDIMKMFTPEFSSTFFEDNYVRPSDDILEFPSKKRNFVFMILESFEASFTSAYFSINCS